MTVEPSLHDFGSFCIGVKSTQKTFTITNLDNQQDIPIDSIDRSSGSGAGDFSPVGFPGGTIQENGTMKFSVAFTPSAYGLRSATYTVRRDDGGPSESVTARGTGIDRRISSDRPTVAFGEQRVGTRSPNQTLIIRNSGANTLHVSKARRTGAASGEFRMSTPAQPFTIPAGNYVSFTVAFQPTAAGLRNSAIEITSDACNKAKFLVSLVGTGVVSKVLVDPNPIDVGASPKDVQGPPTAVTVANGGGAPLKITAVQVLGKDAADFLLEGLPTMPATVPAGESFIFNVRMTPSKEGARVAEIAILSDDPTTPEFSVDLRGTGGKASPSPTASATASASPTSSPTSTISTEPRALGASPNDSLAIILVIAAVLLAFVGLIVIRRFIAVPDDEE